MSKDLTTSKGLLQTEDSEYVRLVSLISERWEKAKETIIQTVSGQLEWRQPVSLDVVFAYFWHTVACFQAASSHTLSCF